MGRDRSIGIETAYGQNGPGSNPGGGRDFPYSSSPAVGSTEPPVHWVSGVFLGDEAAGAWC